MSVRDILWIFATGIGGGAIGLAVFELVRRFASPRQGGERVARVRVA